MVFVLGSNPFALSDGTGLVHDAPEVVEEVAAHEDLLRVEAQHKAGSDGRSEVMHDLWRVLPLQHNAYFYAKVQVRLPCRRAALMRPACLLQAAARRPWPGTSGDCIELHV